MVNWRRWLWGEDGHQDASQISVADFDEASGVEQNPELGKSVDDLAYGANSAGVHDIGGSNASRSAPAGRDKSIVAVGLEGRREGYEDAKQKVLGQAAHLFSSVWLPRLLADFATADSPPEELLALVFEVLLWEELRDGRMKLIKQETVSGEGVSSRYYKPDFVLHQHANAKVIVECDGWQFHRASSEQFAYELKRERELQRLGYRLYRFAASDVLADPWASGFEVIGVINDVWPEFAPIRLPQEVYSLIHVARRSEEQRMGTEPKRSDPDVSIPRNGTEEERLSLKEVAERIRLLPLKKETLPPNVDPAIRQSYARAYEPWSEQEDRWLDRYAKVPEISMHELCETFRRNPGSIKSRLKKLGLSG